MGRRLRTARRAVRAGVVGSVRLKIITLSWWKLLGSGPNG
jgi:hypothetical protein